MGISLSEELRYPIGSKQSVDLLVVGGTVGLVAAMSLQLGTAGLPSLLGVASIAVAGIAVLTLLGYLFRVFIVTLNGSDSPPRFRPLVSLPSDGGRLAVLAVGFAVVPLVVVLTSVGLFRPGFALEPTGFISATAFFAAATVLLIVVSVFGYLFPVAVGRVASGRFRSVFFVGGYREIASDSSYAVSWLFAMLLVVPGWAFLLVAVSSATLFGVAAVFVAFYVHVVATRLVAVGYRESTANVDT